MALQGAVLNSIISTGCASLKEHWAPCKFLFKQTTFTKRLNSVLLPPTQKIPTFFSKTNLETVFSYICVLIETLTEKIFWLEAEKLKNKDEKVVQMEGEFIPQKNFQDVDIIKPS